MPLVAIYPKEGTLYSDSPYVVLKKLYADGFVDKKHYAAVLERVAAIGSSDELKEDDHVAE